MVLNILWIVTVITCLFCEAKYVKGDDFPIHVPRAELRNPITVVTVQVEPFLYPNHTGFIPDLLNDIHELTGLKFHLDILSSGMAGVYNTLIEMVANGEKQLAAGPLTITEFRSHFVDFSHPFLSIHVAGLLRAGNKARIWELEDVMTTWYGVGTLRDSAMEDVLKSSPDPAIQELFQEAEEKDNLMATVQTGVNRAKKEDFVFIIDDAIANHIMKMDPECNLKTVTGHDWYGYGLAFNKNISPVVKDAIEEALLWQREDGSLHLLTLKYFYRIHGHCPVN